METDKEQMPPDDEKPKNIKKKKRCCAPRCISVDNEKVALHKFPEDESRKSIWTSKVPWVIIDTCEVCGLQTVSHDN